MLYCPGITATPFPYRGAEQQGVGSNQRHQGVLIDRHLVLSSCKESQPRVQPVGSPGHKIFDRLIGVAVISVAIGKLTTRSAAARNYSGDPFIKCSGKERDRKSTRLNSSHVAISYAVFC